MALVSGEVAPNDSKVFAGELRESGAARQPGRRISGAGGWARQPCAKQSKMSGTLPWLVAPLGAAGGPGGPGSSSGRLGCLCGNGMGWSEMNGHATAAVGPPDDAAHARGLALRLAALALAAAGLLARRPPARPRRRETPRSCTRPSAASSRAAG